MKSVSRRFADVTAALEDMHGVAVEGQAKDLTPDMQGALLMSLRSSLADLQRLLTGIALLLKIGDGA